MNPCVTRELIDLHIQYHDAFQDLHEYASMYYIPGNWNPQKRALYNWNLTKIINA